MRRLKDNFRAAAKEAGYPEAASLTDEYLQAMIVSYITDPTRYIDWNDSGFIVGVMTDGHVVMPGLLVAMEICWWVDPSVRNEGTGMDLYDGFLTWAKENGCKYIFQGKATDKDFVELSKVYIKAI